jgi:hypothetical protein
MIIIHDHHIWSSYMIIIYDDHIWSSYMIIIYDRHVWSSHMMMIIYDHHTWSSYMIIIYHHHISTSYMIIIHHHHTSSSSYMIMIIYDDHIWWSYMIIIYIIVIYDDTGHGGLGHINWASRGGITGCRGGCNGLVLCWRATFRRWDRTILTWKLQQNFAGDSKLTWHITVEDAVARDRTPSPTRIRQFESPLKGALIPAYIEDP